MRLLASTDLGVKILLYMAACSKERVTIAEMNQYFQVKPSAYKAPLKSLIDGIELADREMQRLLAKHGVKPIEAAGQKFDPHRHQAMFEVPNAEVPEGTVVQVVQEGFAIGDRVLRPAMVGVAKGGAAAAPAPEANGDAEGIDKSA